MADKSVLDWIALVLLVVGGLNWGFVGAFNFDLVNWLFVDILGVQLLANIVYIVVGIAALYTIYFLVKE